MTWRHSPAARSGGMSQVAMPQNTTESPAIRCPVAATIGASAMSTMRAPASTVMARAPMVTQYGGVNSSGPKRYSMSLSATNTAVAPYSSTPTDQATTATSARADRAASARGSSVAAAIAIDGLATTQMNQVPFAVATTDRFCLLSAAVHGMT